MSGSKHLTAVAICIALLFISPPGHTIAIYDASINADMTIDLQGGLLSFIGIDLSGPPVINDPNGPSEADAGGSVIFNNDGFSASAFANGAAVPDPGVASSDSLASITGALVNNTLTPVATTAIVTGSWFIGASVADPLEMASAGVLLDFSFLLDPLIDETVDAPDLIAQSLLLTDGEDPFLFDLILDPFASIGFTFEVRAFGSATGVVQGQPQPIAVAEPGIIVLITAGMLSLGFVRRQTFGPSSSQ